MPMILFKTSDELVKALGPEPLPASLDELRNRLTGEDEGIRAATVRALIAGLRGPSALSCAHLLPLAPGEWSPDLALSAFDSVFGAAAKVREPDEVHSLAMIGVHAVYDVPPLGQKLEPLLRHEAPGVRAVAAVVWGRTQESGSQSLVPLLDDDDDLVSQAARDAALSLVPEAPHIWLPQLVRLLATMPADSRCGTLAMVRGVLSEGAELDPPGRSQLTRLCLAWLRGDDLASRFESAATLGYLVEGNPKVSDALYAALEDGSPEVSSAAAVALIRQQPTDEAAALLARLAGSTEPDDFHAAIGALEGLDDASLASAADAVQKLREHQDDWARESGEAFFDRTARDD